MQSYVFGMKNTFITYYAKSNRTKNRVKLIFWLAKVSAEAEKNSQQNLLFPCKIQQNLLIL